MPNGTNQTRPTPGTKSAAILQLALNSNASPSEIAKTLDCDGSLITHTLKRYGLSQHIIDKFKKNRADIIAGKQAAIMHSLSVEDIQKASPYQKVGMFGILYDKERLERDLSTQNVASVFQDVMALKGQKKDE